MRSERAGGGQSPGEGPVRAQESVLPSDVELPVAFETRFFPIDPGKVIPDPHEIRVSPVVEKTKQGVIGSFRSLAQIGPAGFHLQRSKDMVAVAGPVDGSGPAAGRAALAQPDFEQRLVRLPLRRGDPRLRQEGRKINRRVTSM